MLPGTNSIDDQPIHQNELYLTPNPASQYTYINFNAVAEKRKMIITDSAGRIVIEHQVAEMQTSERLDLSALHKGVYFVTMRTSSSTQKPVKLVIQ